MDKQNFPNQQTPVPPRSAIRQGQMVWGLQKKDYQTNELTGGRVERILTSKPFHPRGIKVMLEGEIVVRVQQLTPPDSQPTVTPHNDAVTPVVDFDDDLDLR